MKILYVTTVGITMGFFEQQFQSLVNQGHTLELACNTQIPLPRFCRTMGLTVHHLPFSRSPLSKDNLIAYKQLKTLITDGDYDMIHTHTPNASACVRIACRNLRKQGLKVLYTAHGFHFYQGAPLLNWLIYYPAEWLCSFFTDGLITINQEDFSLAKKHLHAKKNLSHSRNRGQLSTIFQLHRQSGGNAGKPGASS